MGDPGFESRFITAPDGIRLHVRYYGGDRAGGVPVICLPGLARTAADFDPLARSLAGDPRHPRRVIAIEYRGRGQSDYDQPQNYTVAVELADILAVVEKLGIGPAIFVGTSRGGIITMVLATVRPDLIAGAVLNDIGPVLDPAGLKRIRSYVGKLPQPRDFDEAADILRLLFQPQFPKLSTSDWLASAHRTFKTENGRLVPTYDVRLASALDGIDLEKPVPDLWPQYDALAKVPVMVIRGALSDLLSAQTVAAMRKRKPSLEVLEIADQGHAPLLAEPETIERIRLFIDGVERAYAG